MNYEIKATSAGILIDLDAAEMFLAAIEAANLSDLKADLNTAIDDMRHISDEVKETSELPPEGEYSPEIDDEPRPIHITSSSGDNINFVGVRIAHVGYRRPGSDQWTELVMYETSEGDRVAVKYAYALNRDTFVQAAWAYAGKSMSTIYQMLRSGKLQHRLYAQAGIGNDVDL